ncbi:hypothetical protein CC2G_012767 [Coprinopsis cinerea AmutBmut pab1-1]|nr:hypothetical protein CC2G_012767 [Coprinopsis cinerea AmutBmut pab1-1]
MKIVYYRKPVMPGLRNWSLILMSTSTEGTEFTLQVPSRDGDITLAKPTAKPTDPTHDEGFLCMLHAGKVESRRYAEFCAIVANTPVPCNVANAKAAQWTPLDWVVTILEQLHAKGFSVRKDGKGELKQEVEKQMKRSRVA